MYNLQLVILVVQLLGNKTSKNVFYFVFHSVCAKFATEICKYHNYEKNIIFHYRFYCIK